jgi:hypothetical protein
MPLICERNVSRRNWQISFHTGLDCCAYWTSSQAVTFVECPPRTPQAHLRLQHPGCAAALSNIRGLGMESAGRGLNARWMNTGMPLVTASFRVPWRRPWPRQGGPTLAGNQGPARVPQPARSPVECPASASFTRSISKIAGVGRMEISVLAGQALLYGHIIAFALALATILKEDVRLLRATLIDSASLLASAKLVTWLLLALWVTGVPMVIMDVGTDVSLLLAKPKLLAKLIVVGALTLNGFLLHRVAFPMMTSNRENPNKVATIAVTLGAVSVTSWLYASFLGVSRVVAPYFSLYDFVILYLLALAAAISFALLVVRTRFKLLLKKSSDHLTGISAGQGYSHTAALLEAEIARLALSDMQKRLRAKHSAQQSSVRETSSVTAHRRTSAALGGNAARTGSHWRPPDRNQRLR